MEMEMEMEMDEESEAGNPAYAGTNRLGIHRPRNSTTNIDTNVHQTQV